MNRSFERKYAAGFTFHELLITIAVIGILSAIVLVSLNTAREDALTANVQGELKQIQNAINLMQNNTGKWPNGCEPGVESNDEVRLDAAEAGLLSEPSVGSTGVDCEWTAEEVDKWNGPYMSSLEDPWGTAYWFDPDYHRREDCDIETNMGEQIGDDVPVVVSLGPNRTGGADIQDYDCDDIWLVLDNYIE